uniref:Uncharacterized protein n=1 Tax=Angiostrongylus cantonensis TaxID=6313 RepID=A0A0K0CYG6_ANGCA
MRRITSYREFWRRRGVPDNVRFLTRPYRFEFENNEEEERAIAEAIAREEELMRKEEAEKGCHPEPGARDRKCCLVYKLWKSLANMAYDHYGLFSAAGRPYDEEPDEYARVMPSQLGMSFYSVLEVMIELVCRWDKQFGWYKNLFSKPKGANSDRRRVFTSQKEIELTEHIDRLRREINKRRTRMENDAEDLCGLPTPWRKSRMKSHLKGSSYMYSSREGCLVPWAICLHELLGYLTDPSSLVVLDPAQFPFLPSIVGMAIVVPWNLEVNLHKVYPRSSLR